MSCNITILQLSAVMYDTTSSTLCTIKKCNKYVLAAGKMILPEAVICSKWNSIKH